MLEKLIGKVVRYKSITKRSVQLELTGSKHIIELTISDPWVIDRNDEVIVVGEKDPKTGKFIGYAYKNESKGVFGKFDARVGTGIVFIIAGLLFF